MKRTWKTVAELLGPRRGTVLSIPADATVHAALERLAEHDVGVLEQERDQRVLDSHFLRDADVIRIGGTVASSRPAPVTVVGIPRFHGRYGGRCASGAVRGKTRSGFRGSGGFRRKSKGPSPE